MVTLKEITREDLPRINQWRNTPDLVNFLAAPFRFVNIETDEAWYASYVTNRSNQVRCSIFLDTNPIPVGMISLTGIDTVHRNAEFHILLDPSEHNSGTGTVATRMMVEHGFRNLNLMRIYLTVLEENLRAIRVYEKIGFQREGLLRSAVFKNGRYQNLALMALLHE